MESKKKATVTISARLPKLFVLISCFATFITLLVHLTILLVSPMYFNRKAFLSWTGTMALLYIISTIIYISITTSKKMPDLEFVNPEYDPSDNSLIVKFNFINEAQI